MATPVTFSSDGLTLWGELHAPTGVGPHPALSICHGIPAVPYNAQDTGYHDLAARCAAHGFMTLLFFFRGAGLSEGDFDMGGWSRDVDAAITYLLGFDSVDPSRLFLMGFSGGAAACLHRAACDTRVCGVVSCAAPAHFGDLVEGSALQPCLSRWREIGIIRTPGYPADLDAWVSGFREVAPLAHVAHIAPRATLLLHGDADEVVPVTHAYELYRAAAEPKELMILPDGAHRLRVDERAMTTALSWLHARAAG